jgi:hypothetical protein
MVDFIPQFSYSEILVVLTYYVYLLHTVILKALSSGLAIVQRANDSSP